MVCMYAAIRVDKRFHIPNGSHGPGDYSTRQQGVEKKESLADRVLSEEQVFDNEEGEEGEARIVKKTEDLEAAVGFETKPERTL